MKRLIERDDHTTYDSRPHHKYGIPKDINIMGRKIRIIFDAKLPYKDNEIGCANYREQTISLKLPTDEWDIPRDQLYVTFLHEILHWVLFLLEYEDENNEAFVGRVSEVLYQALEQTSSFRSLVEAISDRPTVEWVDISKGDD